MNRILLEGCRPEPLASYLKALGILRIIGTQADREARGHWSTEGFVITTKLSYPETLEFFLAAYAPTPILSPWNGRGGFKPGKPVSKEIQILSRTGDRRFGIWESAIQVVTGVQGLSDKPKPQEKRAYLQDLRNRLPDEALVWLDAVALVTDSDVHMPLIGGTGGNEGSADYSSNFQQYLIEVFGLGAKKGKQSKSAGWLGEAMTGQGEADQLEGTWGQFDPGSGGGSNSAPHLDAKSLVNPWDFILAMEGLVVFSGASVRRQGQEKADVSLPFSFQTSSAGYASATKEKGRGEVWAPLWEKPTNSRSVGSLFGEGRLVWGGKTARTGLDAARSIATLQHDRRITGFARYAVLERFGQTNIAVSLGMISCPIGERQEVSASESFDAWIRSIKRLDSRTLDSPLHKFELASFALATIADTSKRAALVFELLEAAARLEIACSRSGNARKSVLSISRIYAPVWKPGLQQLFDRSVEARVAWSLASGRNESSPGHPRTFREYVFPIDAKGGWSTSPVVEGFGTTPIAKILSEVAARREWAGNERPASDESQVREGCRVAFESGGRIHVNDAIRFATGDPGDFNEEFFYRCLVAFSILDFRFHKGRNSEPDVSGDSGLTSKADSLGTGKAFELGVGSVAAAVLMHAGSASPAVPSPVGLARQLGTNSSTAIGTLKRSVQIEGFTPMLPATLSNSQWLAASLLLSPNHQHTHNQFLERAGYPSPAMEREIHDRKQLRRAAFRQQGDEQEDENENENENENEKTSEPIS